MPPTSAGYSGTPLPKKLGLKENARILLAGAPDGFAATLGGIAPGAKLVTRGTPPFDVVLWFVTGRDGLDRGLARRIGEMGEGMMWICWPKKASGVATDLTEDVVREAGLARGIVDSKVCAIDATWSGLRFTRRRK